MMTEEEEVTTGETTEEDMIQETEETALEET